MEKLILEDGDVDLALEAPDADTLVLRAIGESWVSDYQGSIAAKLYDDGNGFKATLDDGRKVVLNYSEAFNLLILLTENFKNSPNQSKPLYEVYVRERA